MTREDIIQAIAGDIDIIDGMSTTNAAISALGTIEGLGFVIVPRVTDDDRGDVPDATVIQARRGGLR
jgi:hypothetical protein